MFKKRFLISIGIIVWLYGMPLMAELVDPTAPSDYVKETVQDNKKMSLTATDFVLSAIIISEDAQVAIINNSVFKVGDKIGDGEVKSIDQYSVKLSGIQGVFEIHLFGKDIKEPAK